ncbi:unnamed protein product [Dracunculus medinensis]|uniref:Transposase n=1 Tax=Dracunculus medinensis TaxID=318479 RepID=A0A0N4UII6_DRAME|nr:unnamed protein product [Dracunculus medinensis]
MGIDIDNLKASSFDGNFKPPKISTEQILDTIDEYFEKKEKEPCLVGVNIPDDETTADRFLEKNIIAAAGIQIDYIKKVRRHGKRRSGRPRVLKIRVEDKYMVMSVLRNKNVNSIFPHGSFLRRI